MKHIITTMTQNKLPLKQYKATRQVYIISFFTLGNINIAFGFGLHIVHLGNASTANVHEACI